MDGLELYGVGGLLVFIERSFCGCTHYLMWLSVLLNFYKHFVHLLCVILSNFTAKLIIVSYLRTTIFGLRFLLVSLVIIGQLCVDC